MRLIITYTIVEREGVGKSCPTIITTDTTIGEAYSLELKCSTEFNLKKKINIFAFNVFKKFLLAFNLIVQFTTRHKIKFKMFKVEISFSI